MMRGLLCGACLTLIPFQGTLPLAQSDRLGDIGGLPAHVLMGHGPLTPQPLNDQNQAFPRALSEGHHPIQLMAANAAEQVLAYLLNCSQGIALLQFVFEFMYSPCFSLVLIIRPDNSFPPQAPQQNLVVDINEPQQLWRGNNAFRTGQVLAMERQLSDIDRQTMEALMTSRSGKMNSQASTSHVIDSKVRVMFIFPDNEK